MVVRIEAGQYWKSPWGDIIRIDYQLTSRNHFEEPPWEYTIIKYNDDQSNRLRPSHIYPDRLRYEGKYLKAYNTPLWRVLNES